MGFKNKVYRHVFWLIGLPVVLTLLYAILFYKKPLHIVHQDKSQALSLLGVHDRYSDLLVLDSAQRNVTFKYRFLNDSVFSYAYLVIYPSDSSGWDMSGYDGMSVTIRSSSSTRIPVMLSYEINDSVHDLHGVCAQMFANNISLNKEFTRQDIPFKNFVTPHMWFVANKKREEDVPAPDFSKIQSIVLYNSLELKKGQEDLIEVSEIYVSKDLSVLCWNWVGGMSAYYIVYFLIGYLIRFRMRSTGELTIQYKKLEHRNHRDKEEEQVFNEVYASYTNAEFSMKDLQNSTGLHERKIASIIKSKTGLNFKQFLNSIRTEEAKRMLVDSQLPISDISFKVGYVNTTHFNRVFKSIENCTPKEYRSKHL